MTDAAFDAVGYKSLCLCNRIIIKHLDSLASDFQLLPHDILFLDVYSGIVLLCS